MSKPPIGSKSGKRISRTVLDELPVKIEALLGTARIKVSELTSLSPGDSITLDRKLGDSVELRLNDVVIAYGELVAVGENFGVRVQAIASE